MSGKRPTSQHPSQNSNIPQYIPTWTNNPGQIPFQSSYPQGFLNNPMSLSTPQGYSPYFYPPQGYPSQRGMSFSEFANTQGLENLNLSTPISEEDDHPTRKRRPPYTNEESVHRMQKSLFLRIVNALEAHDPFFQQRADAVGNMGFSGLQKCTNAIRQLAYGGPTDHYDEYLCVAETTGYECLRHFCRGVIEVFSSHYLRKPTVDDLRRLMQMHEQRHGFPGMLGSLDCMHWSWKNCPVGWKGQFTRGDQGVPTIILEAVASQDLWIWHAFFGVAGSNNDINVLNQSPLFTDALSGVASYVPFTVNGTQYSDGYYLTDGIYPEWARFVKSYQFPQDPKRQKFKQLQEAARKDVERAFGVLQTRWTMIRGPTRSWYKETISDIMFACIILHNMIVEDEGPMTTDWAEEQTSAARDNIQGEINQGAIEGFNQYLRRGANLRDKKIHQQLRSDLVEHIWTHFRGDA